MFPETAPIANPFERNYNAGNDATYIQISDMPFGKISRHVSIGCTFRHGRLSISIDITSESDKVSLFRSVP